MQQQVKKVHGSVLSCKWESLLNNLGHSARKLGKFTESLSYHQQALVLVPMSASTYSAIGYVQALQGDLVEAVEAFHKALSLRRDDTFSTTMLNFVIEQLMVESPPYHDYPKEVPKLDPVVGLPLIQLPVTPQQKESTRNNRNIETPGTLEHNRPSMPCNGPNTCLNEAQDQTSANSSGMSIDVDMADVSFEEVFIIQRNEEW